MWPTFLNVMLVLSQARGMSWLVTADGTETPGIQR